MDADRFDRLARSLAAPASRRAALKGLAAGALGLALGAVGIGEAGATHFGCRHVGKPCARKGQCCSGVCRNGACRAHHKGPCDGVRDFCTQGSASGVCGGGGFCFCFVTTGRASFCASASPGIVCSVACERDSECEAVTGAGSACVVCADCPSGTACMARCGSPARTGAQTR